VSELPVLCGYSNSQPTRGSNIFIDIRRIDDWQPACSSSIQRVGRMKLQIEQREREKIVILDVNGRLVDDEDFSLLQRLLLLLDSRRRQIILNLKNVSSIDSTGMDTLSFCAMRFEEAGGRLVFLNLDSPDTGIASYQQETDAVNSFFPDRLVPRYDILEFVKSQQQVRDQTSLEAQPVLSQ
jgi:anti-sigma B factor antagonist